jgi:hypothetical protein
MVNITCILNKKKFIIHCPSKEVDKVIDLRGLKNKTIKAHDEEDVMLLTT